MCPPFAQSAYFLRRGRSALPVTTSLAAPACSRLACSAFVRCNDCTVGGLVMLFLHALLDLHQGKCALALLVGESVWSFVPAPPSGMTHIPFIKQTKKKRRHFPCGPAAFSNFGKHFSCGPPAFSNFGRARNSVIFEASILCQFDLRVCLHKAPKTRFG